MRWRGATFEKISLNATTLQLEQFYFYFFARHTQEMIARWALSVSRKNKRFQTYMAVILDPLGGP